jgi:acyl-CoA reductase-like NAD-dependent aldehyde dehydrogenase
MPSRAGCAAARSVTTRSRTDFGIAFGGFKQSGVGREGSTEGLMPFLETKTIILDALPSARR